MPTLIELDRIPNQSLSIILEQRRYDITIKKTVEVMVANISRDDVLIVEGIRCLPDTPIMPYRYQEDLSGNFFFITQNDEFPDYEKFGITQTLLYFSNAELVEARGES